MYSQFMMHGQKNIKLWSLSFTPSGTEVKNESSCSSTTQCARSAHIPGTTSLVQLNFVWWQLVMCGSSVLNLLPFVLAS